MMRFRCTAPGCGAVRSRALPPASCPDKSRCRFEAFDDAADAAVTQPAAAPPVAPEPVAPVVPPAQPAPPRAAPEPVLAVTIAGTRHLLHGAVTLGRNGDLEVERFRADLSVSRRHARLERRDGRWHLVALSSARTLLDGRLVPPGNAVALDAGAHRVLLGEGFELALELAAPAAAEPAEAGGELDRLLRGLP